MDSVALAATIGGLAVGLAGVGATAWGASQQRASARELAESQHEHERRLAQGERLFERRASAYEDMLRALHVWLERINLTMPILKLAGDPEPPDPPADDEWRAMQVRLRTYGSPAVADDFDYVIATINDFYNQLTATKVAREQGLPDAPFEKLQAKRETVREALRALERLVSEELATL